MTFDQCQHIPRINANDAYTVKVATVLCARNV